MTLSDMSSTGRLDGFEMRESAKTYPTEESGVVRLQGRNPCSDAFRGGLGAPSSVAPSTVLDLPRVYRYNEKVTPGTGWLDGR